MLNSDWEAVLGIISRHPARVPQERVWIWQYRLIMPPDFFDKMGQATAKTTAGPERDMPVPRG